MCNDQCSYYFFNLSLEILFLKCLQKPWVLVQLEQMHFRCCISVWTLMCQHLNSCVNQIFSPGILWLITGSVWSGSWHSRWPLILWIFFWGSRLALYANKNGIKLVSNAFTGGNLWLQSITNEWMNSSWYDHYHHHCSKSKKITLLQELAYCRSSSLQLNFSTLGCHTLLCTSGLQETFHVW